MRFGTPGPKKVQSRQQGHKVIQSLRDQDAVDGGVYRADIRRAHNATVRHFWWWSSVLTFFCEIEPIEITEVFQEGNGHPVCGPLKIGGSVQTMLTRATDCNVDITGVIIRILGGEVLLYADEETRVVYHTPQSLVAITRPRRSKTGAKMAVR